MAKNTEHYNLTKPEQEDFYNIDIISENFEKIDLALKNIQTTAEEGGANAVILETIRTDVVLIKNNLNMIGNNINDMKSAIDNTNSKINGVQSSVNTANTALETVKTGINTANSGISGLQNSVGIANTNINGTNVLVDTINTNTIAIKGIASTNNTMIGMVKTTLDTVNSSVVKGSVKSVQRGVITIMSTSTNASEEIQVPISYVNVAKTVVNLEGNMIPAQLDGRTNRVYLMINPTALIIKTVDIPRTMLATYQVIEYY